MTLLLQIVPELLLIDPRYRFSTGSRLSGERAEAQYEGVAPDPVSLVERLAEERCDGRASTAKGGRPSPAIGDIRNFSEFSVEPIALI
jgi:hypothetical protein